MKITFLYPRFEKFLSNTGFDSELIDYFLGDFTTPPSLGIPIMASLTPPDVEMELIDDNSGDEIDYDAPTDLVAISCFTPQAMRAFEIADEYRAHGKKVIMGGIFPSFMVDECLKHADSVNVGEVEPTKLPYWYRTGDIYIHLAWLEACGNTQVEAMGCGLPVLCTNEGGAREVVEKAHAGFISQADEKYDFTLADVYNPPAPDYEIIAKDIEYMFDHYTTFHDNIDYTAIDIDMAARKYVDFIRECVAS